MNPIEEGVGDTAEKEKETAATTSVLVESQIAETSEHPVERNEGEDESIEEKLPPEVIERILRQVDRLSWPCCRLVSRSWREVLDTLRKKNMLVRWTGIYKLTPEMYIGQVASKGWLSVVQWARANGCPWNAWTCAYAAEGGHLEVLKWARTNGCLWNENTCAYAAKGGHLRVLQWARANGCPWNADTCAFAAEGGHLEVLQWARANRCPWNEDTCALAARGGHLEVLQWARANGCPWDQSTCSNAFNKGHMTVLQWARTNGCPWLEWVGSEDYSYLLGDSANNNSYA
jgi:hypothetical protein